MLGLPTLAILSRPSAPRPEAGGTSHVTERSCFQVTTARDEEKLQVTVPQNSPFGFLPVKGIFEEFHINVSSGWHVYHCKAIYMFRGTKSLALGTDLRDLNSLPPPPTDPIPLYCLGLTAFPWLLQYFTGIRGGPPGSVTALCVS